MPKPSRARTRREDLILRAHAVVMDAIARCRRTDRLSGEEPGLRLALAFLYAVARDRDYIAQPPRAVFDQLWEHLTGPLQGRPGHSCNSSYATTCLTIIERRVDLRAIVDRSDEAPSTDAALVARYAALMREPEPPAG